MRIGRSIIAPIATHNALATGVHGVGSDDVASDAEIDTDIGTHADLDTGVHGSGEDALATDKDIADHALETGTHGATTAATVNRIARRNGSGRTKFAAPSAAGDALIKGTRVTVAELPALTDEMIWKGTGTNVEEVAIPAGREIVTGSYTGNETARQITTGFKCSMVVILAVAGDDRMVFMIPSLTLQTRMAAGVEDMTAHGWLHAADGFGLDNSSNLNKNNDVHYYWAISE